MPDDDVLRYRRKNVPEGGVSVWSCATARDVARAFRAALETDIEGHEVLLIATADPYLDTPVQDAVDRLHGTGAGFGSCPIERRLGRKPTFSWCDA